MTDAGQGVLDDLPLELQLSRIVDKGEYVPAAPPVGVDSATVWRGIDHVDRVRIDYALADALDTRPDPFTRDRAPDERNLTMVPCEHAPAGGGLLDVEYEQRSGLHLVGAGQADLKVGLYHLIGAVRPT